jgi:hypothetical protein
MKGRRESAAMKLRGLLHNSAGMYSQLFSINVNVLIYLRNQPDGGFAPVAVYRRRSVF